MGRGVREREERDNALRPSWQHNDKREREVRACGKGRQRGEGKRGEGVCESVCVSGVKMGRGHVIQRTHYCAHPGNTVTRERGAGAGG